MKKQKTIAMVNQKGGVGKSTVSLLMASAIQHAGFSVSIDDRDPQRSSTAIARNMGLTLGANADIIIIDTAPNMLAATMGAIREASYVVILTSPSPTDLVTTAATIEIVRRERNADQTCVLFNSVQAGTRLAGMIDKVAAGMTVPVLKNRLGRRQAYQLAQLDGGWTSLSPLAKEEILRVGMEIMAYA